VVWPTLTNIFALQRHFNIGPAAAPKEVVNLLSDVMSLNNSETKQILA